MIWIKNKKWDEKNNNKWYEREIKDDINCNSHNINDRIQNIKKYPNFIGH